jgi:preprotein translocase SecE subunit
VKKILNNIKKYFKGVGKEIKRIRWTTGKELAKYSLTAVLFMLFLGVYFYAIDILVSLLRSVA